MPLYRRSTINYPAVKVVIKKRPEANLRGHSWKIAYADLMTAMMAFFLLLWLYSALPKQQKVEIAQYFTPTEGILGQSGIGANGGKDASLAEGAGNIGSNRNGITRGQVSQGPLPQAPQAASAKDDEATDASHGASAAQNGSTPMAYDEAFMALQEQYKQMMSRTENNLFANNLKVDTTRRHLSMRLLNTEENVLFDDETQELTTAGIQALDVVANIILRTQRKFILTGYTASAALENNSQRQWDLSIQHANIVLRFLMSRGVPPSCVQSVSGQSVSLPPGGEAPPEDRVAVSLLPDLCSAILP